MAEIRKFKPATGAIADALAAAMGEPIRPVTPGSRPAGAEQNDGRGEAAGPAALSRTVEWQGFTVRTAPPAGGVLGDAGDPDGGTGTAGAEAEETGA
ncbi:MAG: hypothetical protein LKI24_17680 [Acidipropionibacterium sp.]|jgi:hypothetical protein|nr:hypothetical protein [Acidipropionibacterium sp.]